MNNKDEFLDSVRLNVEMNTFKESVSLDQELRVMTLLDPDAVNYQINKRWLVKRRVNDDDFRVYRSPNPRGNSLCQFGLNKQDGEIVYSNSENARFTSKNRLTELILANPDFNYFFTGTLDPKKWNRQDFATFYRSFKRFLHHKHIKYILVPEYHADGKSIHLHGVFNESIEPYLAEFNLSQKLPNFITQGLKDGREIFNFPEYAKRFGYVSIEHIRNLEAVARYITKYVAKSFDDPESRVSYNRYFCSLGLNRPYNDYLQNSDFDDFEPVYFSHKLVKVYYKRKSSATNSRTASAKEPALSALAPSSGG